MRQSSILFGSSLRRRHFALPKPLIIAHTTSKNLLRIELFAYQLKSTNGIVLNAVPFERGHTVQIQRVGLAEYGAHISDMDSLSDSIKFRSGPTPIVCPLAH